MIEIDFAPPEPLDSSAVRRKAERRTVLAIVLGLALLDAVILAGVVFLIVLALR